MDMDRVLHPVEHVAGPYEPGPTQNNFWFVRINSWPCATAIVERIASGSTLGKNYYDKQDHEDGKPKAKKTTILQPSEVRILKQAFWLLRAQGTPKTFSKLVVEISFLRGIMQEAVEIFLTTITEY